MASSQAIPLSESIKMLKWGIDNGKTITDIQKHFKLGDNLFRKHRKLRKNDPSYPEFIEVYNRLLGRSIRTIDFQEEHVDDFIDKHIPYLDQKLDFKQDAEGSGTLDARGGMHVKTLDQLLKEAKVDTNLWEVTNHIVNKWDVTMGGGKTYQNWQVKAWLKKRQEIADAINFEDFYKDLLKQHNPAKYTPIKYKGKENNLLEINIFDLHLGKLCWSEEVENNYDTKIASKRFFYALNTLLQRASSTNFERILFPIGNDFFNSDTHINTTTMGTRQDEDSRWQKTFRTGVQLIVEGIDLMRQFAPVDVVVVPGNHDFTKSFFLGETISAWYRNDKSVTVNNSPNPRKYYEYGNVLLGLTHGNNEKIEALRSLMAFEAKAAWARTKYKEFHLGHQHRKLSVKHTIKSDLLHEELGVVVRSMSSMAGTDAWHHLMGYVGPVRAAEAFIWNKEDGLLGNLNVNIKYGDDE